jgi:hypothetical protein
MADTVQLPPQPREGLGCCLGKGCLIFVLLLAFLATALVFGAFLGLRTFVSTEPRQLPQIATSEEKQQAVLQRWDAFQSAVHERRSASESTTTPNEPSPNPKIELTADDINQIIASNRHSRGHAFVSIQNGVGHVAVSFPTPRKARLGERYLNADFEVRSAPNGDVSGIQITLHGARWLGRILGGKSLHSWIDPYVSEYRSEYDVTSFKIVGDKVLLEAGRGQ